MNVLSHEDMHVSSLLYPRKSIYHSTGKTKSPHQVTQTIHYRTASALRRHKVLTVTPHPIQLDNALAHISSESASASVI